MTTDKTLYKPVPSSNSKKKYMVYVKNKDTGRPKLIHYGSRGMSQYHDKIGKYSKDDNNDPERRRLWYARHGRTKDKNTALYWAAKTLW